MIIYITILMSVVSVFSIGKVNSPYQQEYPLNGMLLHGY
jgi:hypothetical protein